MSSLLAKTRTVMELLWAEVRSSVRSYFSPLRAVLADITQAVRQNSDRHDNGRPRRKSNPRAIRAR